MNTPIFLDCEASSLGVASYPTEVGWSRPDGSIASLRINPYAIEDWTDWDPVAQGLTGISRELLHKEGHPPRYVAQRLNAELHDRRVYTSAPNFDRAWLGVLFDAADIEMRFTVGDLWEPFHPFVDDQSAMWREVERAREAMGYGHRAGSDVEQLLRAWRAVARR